MEAFVAAKAFAKKCTQHQRARGHERVKGNGMRGGGGLGGTRRAIFLARWGPASCTNNSIAARVTNTRTQEVLTVNIYTINIIVRRTL